MNGIKPKIFSFRFTTKQIAASAICLALYVIITIISKVSNMVIFPTVPFLKIELGEFIFLIAVRLVGIILSTFLIIISIWLRFWYNADGPIDLIALMIADLIFIWLFFALDVLIKTKKTLVSTKQKEYIFVSIAIILAILVVSLLMTLFNYLFIYDWYAYYMNYSKADVEYLKGILVPSVLPFNIIKFSINGLIFMLVYHVVGILERQFYNDASYWHSND